MTVALRRFNVKFALRALALLALVALGWFAYSWLRDSPLVAVKHVEVTGLSLSPDAKAIEKSLTTAARDMTTLHVDVDQLQAAVRQYPVVRSVSASADFPNSLKVVVHEYRPSAVIDQGGGKRVAVAEDGTLLPRLDRSGLPVIKTKDATLARRLTDQHSLQLVGLLAEAPQGLRAKLSNAYWGSHGIRVRLHNGPDIEFGSPASAGAKWRAAARVLADPTSVGASLIDVRVPERPAAAGFAAGEQGTASAAPAGPASEAGATAIDPAATDPAAVDTADPAVVPSDPAAAPVEPGVEPQP